MDASTSANGGPLAYETIVGPTGNADTIPGVASLDPQGLQQTKSEIRNLAAELAQLAHTALEPADFYEGFLPRLCAAMGAKAAGVWRLDNDSQPELIADHRLPTALFVDPGDSGSSIDRSLSETPQTSDPLSLPMRSRVLRASEAHQRILQCVAAEAQPILVPPGNVKLETERPTNPLGDALIVIPLRPEERVEFLLEVVQRPSGGPAAQRGYLRFVAQMGDLMADYLRRHQLRQYASQHQRLENIEAWLTVIAAAASAGQRQQLVADALEELLNAERVILYSGLRRQPVVAISHVRSLDPRSETVLAAQALLQQYLRLEATSDANRGALPHPWIVFRATDRRQSPHSANADRQPQLNLQADIDRLCETLACRLGVYVALDSFHEWSALITYADDSSTAFQDLQRQQIRNERLLAALGGQLQAGRGTSTWLSSIGCGQLLPTGLWNRILGRPALRTAHSPSRLQPWLLRVALLSLATLVAFFPVAQQVSVTASLQPVSKQMYYAPAAGIVSEVLVDEGESIQKGTPLLRLTSHELESQLENLQIELKKNRGQIEEKTSRLNRGNNLTAREKDLLEFERREYQTTEQALELQRSELSERLAELSIVARQAGTIATWDLRNRLLHHPVQAGQLLTSTFAPEDKWRLQLSIPDYRVGLVATALERSPQKAVPVHFSLTSYPDQVLEAYAVSLAPQVTTHYESAAVHSRVVRTEAVIPNSAALPLKKDGAIARATLDCGKTPLCWLVFRDAYWALSSRIRMLW
jgi:hypothetical protein